jgi:hypothetical protein
MVGGIITCLKKGKLSMRNITQVEILYWAKTQHNINVKYVHRSLEDKDFVNLCHILMKAKHIGSVVSVKSIVDEYLEIHGVEYLPQSFKGVSVDLHSLFQTHPLNEQDEIEVSLYHLLLNNWCRPTRENHRVLKKHLKELGYGLTERVSVHSKTLQKESFVKLKESYPLSLPLNLKRYKKPTKWVTITDWIYDNQPKYTLDGSPYKIKSLGSRWEAYFTKRFIDLFELSELEYLYKHPLQYKDYVVETESPSEMRGVYENAPPVLALCDLTVRDIFKETNARLWIDKVLRLTSLNQYKKEAGSEEAENFLDGVYDEVIGKLSNTVVNTTVIENYASFQGWTSIIVICYVNDILGLSNLKE